MRCWSYKFWTMSVSFHTRKDMKWIEKLVMTQEDVCTCESFLHHQFLSTLSKDCVYVCFMPYPILFVWKLVLMLQLVVMYHEERFLATPTDYNPISIFFNFFMILTCKSSLSYPWIRKWEFIENTTFNYNIWWAVLFCRLMKPRCGE